MSYSFTISGIIHGNPEKSDVDEFIEDTIGFAEDRDDLDVEVTYDFVEEDVEPDDDDEDILDFS